MNWHVNELVSERRVSECVQRVWVMEHMRERSSVSDEIACVREHLSVGIWVRAH